MGHEVAPAPPVRPPVEILLRPFITIVAPLPLGECVRAPRPERAADSILDYAENYERCCKEHLRFLQRHFMGILSGKARSLGRKNHRMRSLKYVVDTYFDQANSLRVMDCGPWDGWFSATIRPSFASASHSISIPPSRLNCA